MAGFMQINPHDYARSEKRTFPMSVHVLVLSYISAYYGRFCAYRKFANDACPCTVFCGVQGPHSVERHARRSQDLAGRNMAQHETSY